MPHGTCYLWKPGLVRLHLTSDLAIALAYFSIPITLVYILRRRQDIPFDFLFFLFAAFIIFCGLGHAFDVWTLWHPNYWISGYIRAMTALVSVATAIALWLKIPQIIDLPSPKQVNQINQQLKEKIAELEQQKATIHQQEQFLRSIYDNVREAIFVVDLEADGIFRYQSFNLAAQTLTGVEDVADKTPADIFPPEAATAVEQHYQECCEAGTTISYEECLPFQGKNSWWLTNLNPIKDETAKIYRLISTSLDISDRKQAEQILKESEARLRKAKQVAEAANRAKDYFLANISHELRTPLNSIIGFTQILKKDLSFNEVQAQHLESIYQSGQHLLILINDLLDLAKITAKKLHLEPSNFDFIAFLKNLVMSTNLQARQKGLDFYYQLLSSLPRVVYGDQTRLRQVLLNLLNNAVKFTETGSIVFTVGSVKDLNKIRFQVQDTGVGISAERLKIIFLPFEQLPNSDRAREGTGLGLTISSNLVRLMGSQIQVKSTPGEGSTFWFDLDLPAGDSTDACINQEHQEQFIGYEGRRRKILVVDDNINNRQVLINYLKPLGFELSEAENGRQGLVIARSFQPNLILLDLVMPIMDGVSMATLLRQDSQLKEVLIFAISANTKLTEYVNSALDLFDAFLSKPVDLNQLLDMLEASLELKWITTESTETNINISTPPKLIPDREQLEELLKLAKIGDISQVIAQVESLEKLNECYSLFTRQVKELALKFQLQKLVVLFEKNLSNPSSE